MGELTAFGDKSKTIFLNDAESHKLHLAFEADAAIKKGQPVKLTATGLIVPLAEDDSNTKAIGVSIQNGADGDQVTVAMRGYTTVYAMSDAALTPGPVAYAGPNGTDGDYMNYKTAVVSADAALVFPAMTGWSLDVADGANDLIRVVLF